MRKYTPIFAAFLAVLAVGLFVAPFAIAQPEAISASGPVVPAAEQLPTLDEVNISWPPATIEGWIALVFGALGSLVLVASGVARLTPTPKDDEWINRGGGILVMLKKLIDGLAVGGIFRGLQRKE